MDGCKVRFHWEWFYNPEGLLRVIRPPSTASVGPSRRNRFASFFRTWWCFVRDFWPRTRRPHQAPSSYPLYLNRRKKRGIFLEIGLLFLPLPTFFLDSYFLPATLWETNAHLIFRSRLSRCQSDFQASETLVKTDVSIHFHFVREKKLILLVARCFHF